MPIEIEHAHLIGMSSRVVPCQVADDLARSPHPSELVHAPAHRAHLGRTVEADEAPEVSRRHTREALGPRLSEKSAEHQGENE